jgi:hypothetical protein
MNISTVEKQSLEEKLKLISEYKDKQIIELSEQINNLRDENNKLKENFKSKKSWFEIFFQT